MALGVARFDEVVFGLLLLLVALGFLGPLDICGVLGAVSCLGEGLGAAACATLGSPGDGRRLLGLVLGLVLIVPGLLLGAEVGLVLGLVLLVLVALRRGVVCTIVRRPPLGVAGLGLGLVCGVPVVVGVVPGEPPVVGVVVAAGPVSAFLVLGVGGVIHRALVVRCGAICTCALC